MDLGPQVDSKCSCLLICALTLDGTRKSDYNVGKNLPMEGENLWTFISGVCWWL